MFVELLLLFFKGLESFEGLLINEPFSHMKVMSNEYIRCRQT